MKNVKVANNLCIRRNEVFKLTHANFCVIKLGKLCTNSTITFVLLRLDRHKNNSNVIALRIVITHP